MWPGEKFIDGLLGKLPSARHPETGEVLWPDGMRLHGVQREIAVSNARFKILTGGWRFGKSYIAAFVLLIDIMFRWAMGKMDDLYWIVGPEYRASEKEIEYLHDFLVALGIPHEFQQPKESSWSITFPDVKTQIVTRTGREAASIASKAVRGMVLAEANQMGNDLFTQARGRLAETRGWLLIEGTFENEEGGAWFRRLTVEWKKGAGGQGIWFAGPTWDNRAVFPLGRDEPVLRAEEQALTPVYFMEKYGGVPGLRSDVVFDQPRTEYHVAHRYPLLGLSFDPEQPVVLWSDPGTGHAYSVMAVQFWGNVAWVVDAVYRWGRTAQEIIQECAARPWAKNVVTAIFDRASKQRNANGEPVIEQWAKDWLRLVGQRISIHTEYIPLSAGYEIHRRALLNGWPEEMAQLTFGKDKNILRITDPLGPRLMFAPEAAKPLFGGLIDDRAYEGEYNMHRFRKNAAGSTTRDEPVDLDNDAIKAINYGLYVHFGPAGTRPAAYRFYDDFGKKVSERTTPSWEIAIAS